MKNKKALSYNHKTRAAIAVVSILSLLIGILAAVIAVATKDSSIEEFVWSTWQPWDSQCILGIEKRLRECLEHGAPTQDTTRCVGVFWDYRLAEVFHWMSGIE